MALATSYRHLQAFQEIEKKASLAAEIEGLKKNLEQEKQKHLETIAVAEELKSKLNVEADKLKTTISQHALEKRALQHKFEEAMQRVVRSNEEIKQLKTRQEQDAQERDIFYSKLEQLDKQLSES